MKKWKIYFLILSLLSGSLLSSLFISKREALAVESYKVPADQDRTIRRGFYDKINVEGANFDIHYYFIARDKYSEEIEVFAWTCAYRYYDSSTYTNTVKIKENCGISLLQEGGYFNVNINAGLLYQTSYSRRKSRLNINDYITSVQDYRYYEHGQKVASYTDSDLKNGLTLLGGTTLKANEWNLKENGYLAEPVGGSNGTSTPENNNSGSSNSGFSLDLGAFVKGIVDGLAQFFEPMRKSLDQVGNYIKDDPFGKIMKFLTDIPEFIVSLIIPSFDDLKLRVDDSVARFNNAFSLFFFSSHFPVNNNTGNYNSASQPITSTSYHHTTFKINISDVINAVNSAPPVILYLARAFIWFAFMIWLINRVQSSIPVILGTIYVWQKWYNQQEED